MAVEHPTRTILRKAISTDPSRKVLTKAMRQSGPSGTVLVGTDTHRLVVITESTTPSDPADPMLVDLDLVQPEDGKYPDWERVVPTTTKLAYKLDYDDFREQLLALKYASSERSGRVTLRWDGKCFSMTCQFGSSTLVLSEPDTQAPFECAFNLNYLLDCVPKAKEPVYLLMWANTNSRPVVLTYLDKEGSPCKGEWGSIKVVLMPMALA